jgi:hypothetical protein
MKKIKINNKIKKINAQRYELEREIRQHQSKVEELKREMNQLAIKMSKVDGLPILELDEYMSETDEYARTGGFFTEDPNDKRFEKYSFDYKKGKTASLSAGYEGSYWAMYSMNENPLTVIEGKVKFFAKANSFWGGDETKDYESDVIENPTHATALLHLFKAMCSTGDCHHCYLEGFDIKESNGVKIVEFVTGS